MPDQIRGPRVHRPAASATWEFEHRWGSMIGDSTTLRVTRNDGGALTIGYGREEIEIRRDLVAKVAEMVAAAAEWTDAALATRRQRDHESETTDEES